MARTVINIDEILLARARRLTRLSRKVDIVNHALAELIRVHDLARMLALRGKMKWRGDLDAMRSRHA